MEAAPHGFKMLLYEHRDFNQVIFPNVKRAEIFPEEDRIGLQQCDEIKLKWFPIQGFVHTESVIGNLKIYATKDNLKLKMKMSTHQ